MPKQPLYVEHLMAISSSLAYFASNGTDTVHVAVCVDLKTKVDRKMNGIIPAKGYKIKLTRPELELVKKLNHVYSFSRDAVICNSYLRLLQQNL